LKFLATQVGKEKEIYTGEKREGGEVIRLFAATVEGKGMIPWR